MFNAIPGGKWTTSQRSAVIDVMNIVMEVDTLPFTIDSLKKRITRDALTWLPLSPSPSRQTYVQRLSPNYSTVHFSRSDLEIGKNKNVEEEGGRGPI